MSITLNVPTLFLDWSFWYVVGVAVVLIAATLLIAILLVARSIAGHAGRALAAGARIEENTRAIWALQGALEGLETIRERAAGVEEKAAFLADAVHGAAGAPRTEA